jgi:sugar fermentation stimulation protein A
MPPAPLTQLTPPLQQGILRRRYKRFLADVETGPGTVETMHCPNTGAMLGCDLPGSECWYSRSSNPKRKYSGTLEVVVTGAGRIGINTGRANTLVAQALATGTLAGFESAVVQRAEVPIPDEAGRFDFLLEREGRSCYLEIKSVTLLGEGGLGLFPDTVSERALKHVQALQRRVEAGDQAVLIFCVQHTGVSAVSPADRIYPAYGAALREARAAGVEVLAYGCQIEKHQLRVSQPLAVRL